MLPSTDHAWNMQRRSLLISRRKIRTPLVGRQPKCQSTSRNSNAMKMYVKVVPKS